jgi:hypothetical protein
LRYSKKLSTNKYKIACIKKEEWFCEAFLLLLLHTKLRIKYANLDKRKSLICQMIWKQLGNAIQYKQMNRRVLS